jgi:hypothetical protein
MTLPNLKTLRFYRIAMRPSLREPSDSDIAICLAETKNPALVAGCGVLDSSPVSLLRRVLTRTSGANKYEDENKQRATHAGSREQKAGDGVALAVALRHAVNRKRCAKACQHPGAKIFPRPPKYAGAWKKAEPGFLYVFTAGRPNTARYAAAQL